MKRKQDEVWFKDYSKHLAALSSHNLKITGQVSEWNGSRPEIESEGENRIGRDRIGRVDKGIGVYVPFHPFTPTCLTQSVDITGPIISLSLSLSGTSLHQVLPVVGASQMLADGPEGSPPLLAQGQFHKHGGRCAHLCSRKQDITNGKKNHSYLLSFTACDLSVQDESLVFSS